MNQGKVRIGVGFLLIFLAIQTVDACSCGLRQSLEKDYSETDTVFIGKVVSIEAKHGKFVRLMHELVDSSYDVELYDVIVELEVIESFKGLGAEKKVKVITSDPSVCCICGYQFEVNSEYLVFASGPPLTTNICFRTQPLAGAFLEVNQVRALSKTEKDRSHL